MNFLLKRLDNTLYLFENAVVHYTKDDSFIYEMCTLLIQAVECCIRYELGITEYNKEITIIDLLERLSLSPVCLPEEDVLSNKVYDMYKWCESVQNGSDITLPINTVLTARKICYEWKELLFKEDNYED